MKIYSRAILPPKVRLTFPAQGRTIQSQSKDTDINLIMAKYQKSGAISHFSKHAARYDFCDGIEFHGAMNIVKEAETMFANLPSTLRGRFENPGAFLDFVQDEANAEEMVVLGLRDPVGQEEPPEARAPDLPPAGEIVAPAASEAAVAAAEASD